LRSLAILANGRPDTLIINSAYQVPGDSYSWDDSVLTMKFSETLAELKKKLPNTKIIVVGPVPNWSVSPQRTTYLSYLELTKNSVSKVQRVPVRQKAILMSELDEALRAVTISNGAKYISAIGELCNQEGCISRVGGESLDFIAADYGHLTKSGSEFFVEKIRDKILDGLEVPQSRQDH
jgi:hypothetical protein